MFAVLDGFLLIVFLSFSPPRLNSIASPKWGEGRSGERNPPLDSDRSG